jgi:hypothetical protein
MTRALLAEHPLRAAEVVDVVLDAWRRILTTKIAGELEIGVDVTPGGQMMGNFLESVMVVDFTQRHPGVWREQQSKPEKDLVYIPDEYFSTEIKTSSDARSVFGNRSYAQPSLPGTKDRDGYYITVNFEKFSERNPPRIRSIKMGWLNHADWVPQLSPRGQQAHIELNARRGKLLEIYANSSS